MSRPADSYPPSRRALEAARGLCAPIVPRGEPKVLRRCTLCGHENSAASDIRLFCRHGGEWFLMSASTARRHHRAS